MSAVLRPPPLVGRTTSFHISPRGAELEVQDARQIVRLFQCTQCSRPFREPVTIPCGATLCRGCIPELYTRGVTYPGTSERLQGFTCPITTCGASHAIADCSVDVVIKKIMSDVRNTMKDYREIWIAVERMMYDTEKSPITAESKPSVGGPWGIGKLPSELALCATYFMAETGQLPREKDIQYASISRNSSSFDGLDTRLFNDLKRSVRQEVDCTVCYNIFLSPFTTICGHTFCRRCTQDALGYSNSCPICRRQRAIPRCLVGSEIPRNLFLSSITNAFWCTELADRRDVESTSQQEGSEEQLEGTMEELDTPIFVCACSLPETPTPLHVFEPRYRRMIQQVMQTDSKTFGMVSPNPNLESQEDLGPVYFHQYGTLLRITEISNLAGGRSIVITRGISRFQIIKYGMRDGYLVGKIRLFDDLTIGAEESLEQHEIDPPTARNISADDHFGAPPQHVTEALNFNTMTTRALYEHCAQFIKDMKASSAPWLTQSTLRALGDCPSDPARFPWWFASVLPTSENSKYVLLCESSVRKRLQICASWVQYVRSTQSELISDGLELDGATSLRERFEEFEI